MSEKAANVETLKCPQCGHALKPVTYHGGAMALNRDQWESVRAGDWYCDKCKSNVSNTGYKYYWNRELVESPATVQPLPQPTCEKCGQPLKLMEGFAAVLLPCECEPPPQPAGGEGEKARAAALAAIAAWQAMKLDCKPGESSTVEGFMALLKRDEAQLADAITDALLRFALHCPRCAELERQRNDWKADYEAAKIRSNEWQRKFTDAEAKVAELERERDDIYQSHLILERRINELIKERDELKRERDEARGIVAEVNNSVIGSHSYFTKPSCVDAVNYLKEYSTRVSAERDALKAKLATIERHMASCRATAGVPDDETLAVYLAELKAKCERLENQLGPTGKIQWEAQGLRLEFLEAAIRKHRDQRGDDRCWLDDEELYRALPEGFTPPQRGAAVELELCKKFIQCRHNPATEYVSPQRRIEAMEKALRPFANIFKVAEAMVGRPLSNGAIARIGAVEITVEHLRDANAALAGKGAS